MSLQESVAVRNAKLDAIEVTIGTDPILEIRTLAQPANCAAADVGTLLASMTLPTNWLANASGGAKAQAGTWSDPSANNTGTAAHWRIKDSTGTTCHMQGSCGTSGSGEQLELLTLSLVATMPISIASFTLTAGNS